MSKTYFIAGTDTGVGKTLVTAALLSLAKRQGLQALGLKPLAAGCVLWPQGWRNDDALLLAEYASVSLAYEAINPVALRDPIAPHIAAQREGRVLKSDDLVRACQVAMQCEYDLCFIEGAGGWRVPLNHREYLSDVVKALSAPVILVVGLRLGCLNHALLSVEAIQRDGLPIAAWVANSLDSAMMALDDNFVYLRDHLPFPCLGHIPYLTQADPVLAADYLNVELTYEK